MGNPFALLCQLKLLARFVNGLQKVDLLSGQLLRRSVMLFLELLPSECKFTR